RHLVPHLRESLQRLAADALGRRVGRAQLRVLLLDLLQLAKELVVLGVRDVRLVQDVVAMRVVVQELQPRSGAFFNPRRGHDYDNSRRACAEPAARSWASRMA